jgi:hypothetical protein
MQSSGWTQQRSAAREVSTHVELASDRPRQGRYALHLGSSNPTSSATEDAASSPFIRVASAPVRLNAASVVRIFGWIRGTAPENQPILRIRDTLGGESLADEPALSGEWRPFALYRAAPRAMPLTLTFELIGRGDVWIDGVSIEVLNTPMSPLASQAPGYPRNE